MSTYVREQRVEAVRWQGEDARYAAGLVIQWVNANGGEARYQRCDGPNGGHCHARIAIRTNPGWLYAAPGDYIEMGTEFWTREHPIIQNAKQTFREFIVRNAGYFSGWRVMS